MLMQQNSQKNVFIVHCTFAALHNIQLATLHTLLCQNFPFHWSFFMAQHYVMHSKNIKRNSSSSPCAKRQKSQKKCTTHTNAQKGNENEIALTYFLILPSGSISMNALFCNGSILFLISLEFIYLIFFLGQMCFFLYVFVFNVFLLGCMSLAARASILYLLCLAHKGSLLFFWLFSLACNFEVDEKIFFLLHST